MTEKVSEAVARHAAEVKAIVELNVLEDRLKAI